MPTVYALVPDHKPQFLDANGDPASGAKLFVYTAGSSTKATTYTESDGDTANSNPIVLDSRGETASGVYAATGTYKLVLAPSTDTDPPASAIWTRDNVTPVNDIAAGALSEWIDSGFTPTYVSATSFTVVGDQTSSLHVGRRLRTINSGGTIYSTITVTAFTSLTTVTVVNDSGTLDAGLSSVSYGLLSADNQSIASEAVSDMGLQPLGKTSVSAAASLTVTDLEAGFSYFGKIVQGTPAGSCLLEMTLSTDNGSTFITSAGAYFTGGAVMNGTDVSTTHDNMFMTWTGHTVGAHGHFWLHSPMDSAIETVMIASLVHDSSVNAYLHNYRVVAESNDAFRITVVSSTSDIDLYLWKLRDPV